MKQGPALFNTGLLAVLLLFAACNADEPANGSSVTPLTSSQSNFNNTLSTNTGDIGNPPEVNPASLITSSTDTSTPGYITIAKTYRHAPGYSEMFSFTPTSDVVYPGALLIGESIASGQYIPLTGKRGPTTISISLMNLGGSVAATVTNTSLSTVRQAINDILSREVSGATPAYISFTMEQVYSTDHVGAVLGGNYGNGTTAVGGQFDFTDTARKTKILVRFLQVYYTIDIDIPVYPCLFFAADADWDHIHNQISNTSPVYVSSVSYGRMALFSFESAHSATDLRGAIEASFQAAQQGISLDATNRYILDNASIKATIVGGNGLEAAQAVTGFDGTGGLKEYLVNGGNYSPDSPGVPIAYKLRYLRNNALARIVFNSEYQISDTYEINNSFRVSDMSVMCIDNNGDTGGKGEYYGFCEVYAYIAPYDSVKIKGSVNGIPRSTTTVWNVDRDHSTDWELGEWQEKGFNSDIVFTVEGRDMDNAYIRVGGWMKEDDGWLLGTDDLGSAYKTVKLTDLSSYWYYTRFSGDSQEARIWFRVTRVE